MAAQDALPLPALAEPVPTVDCLEANVIRKVTFRLIPFLFLLYVINILDRTNIGIARLQMVDQLGLLTEGAYALGASIFYVGYVIFEVPSNLILAQLGARRWIARILVSWGLVSTAMMFVTGPWSFLLLRVLLGIAEAGFFPGVILYLSQWFPERVRARAISRFMVAGLVAGILGSPLSASILEFMHGTGGLAGWQWVFLLEGLPAVLLGFVTLAYLTDRPAEATWLNHDEREWLQQRMTHEEAERGHSHGGGLRQALTDGRVWLLVAVYSTVALGDNGLGFYLPKFLSGAFPDWKTVTIGFAAAVPALFAIVAMLISGAHSDRTGERRWHVAGAAGVAAVGWTLAAFVDSPWLFAGTLCVTMMGMKCMLAPFWALPTSFLSHRAAAGGIALINSVANIGGFFGPNALGQSKQLTGSFTLGMCFLAVALLAGGGLVLCLPPRRSPGV
jgi:ACS family tartrate transporter-like MFS transporter